MVEPLMVGEVAKRADVNVQTIRYYEREGLLPKPPRTSSGYRVYPPDSVDRVRFIKRAQALCFSLEDAKELLDLRDHPETACPQVLRRAESKIAETVEQIRVVRAVQRELRRLAGACRRQASPHACPLLKALDTPARPAKRPKKLGDITR